ncbi:MAG: hypothetical protein FWC50_09405, partial [Planctomycetaceae bacterium]|nr:hypothetical protein [Planctomycetaceae bacterium]
MDTKVEPPPDFLATKTAASVGRCYPTLMSRSIVQTNKTKSLLKNKKITVCITTSIGESTFFPCGRRKTTRKK